VTGGANAFVCLGPNGPLPGEILKMYPNAPLIKRQGEVNAWDNPEIRAAIRATGKKQIIVAGIVTDVCTSRESFLVCIN
jgi:nicotinamidase-related amidase